MKRIIRRQRPMLDGELFYARSLAPCRATYWLTTIDFPGATATGLGGINAGARSWAVFDAEGS